MIAYKFYGYTLDENSGHVPHLFKNIIHAKKFCKQHNVNESNIVQLFRTERNPYEPRTTEIATTNESKEAEDGSTVASS